MEKLIEISSQEYHSGIGIGSHQLIDILKSAKTFHWKHILKRSQQENDDFRFGRIVHAAILEPTIFNSKKIIMPQFNRRTKVGRQEYEAFMNSVSPDSFVMDEEESEILLDMIGAVSNHKKAKNLLRSGRAELSGYWTDEETGILCRCRPDFLIEEEHGVTIVDLKTTRDASIEWFSRDLRRYKYFLQAAYYSDGIEVITKKPTIFIFMAIEKTPPYEIGLYVADETVIECGRAAYKKALKRFKKCNDENRWPGMTEEFLNISMPHDALYEWGSND